MLPQAAREHEKKQPMSSSEQERAPPARTPAPQLIDDPETMRQSRRAAREPQERQTEAAEGPVAGRVLQAAVAARATQERRAAFEVTWGSGPQQRESVGGVSDAPVAQGSEAEIEQQEGRVVGRLRQQQRGRLQHQQQEQRQPAASSS